MKLGEAITKSEIDVFDIVLDVHDQMPTSAQNEVLQTAMGIQAMLTDLTISEIVALIGTSMAIELAEQANLVLEQANDTR